MIDFLNINYLQVGNERQKLAFISLTNHQIFEKLKPWYPLGRVGTPVDVTEAVLFLLSDKAQWISGSEFVVDGGLLAGLAPMYKMVEGSD